MALIICKKCGKNISDTSTRCIHCGTPIKDEAETLKVESPAKPKNETLTPSKKLANFHKLSEDQQVALENEFLKSDKSARKYRRKGIEIGKFAWLTILLFPIGRGLVILQTNIKNKYFNGQVFRQDCIDFSQHFLVALVFVLLFSFVMTLTISFSIIIV